MHIFIFADIDSVSALIIVTLIILYIIFTVMFEINCLQWIRKPQYIGWNDLIYWYFIFSSLMNVLYTLPLKRFDIKNDICKLNVEILFRYLINLIFHLSIITVLIFRNAIANQTNEIIIDWIFHILYWILIVINFICLYLINFQINYVNSQSIQPFIKILFKNIYVLINQNNTKNSNV